MGSSVGEELGAAEGLHVGCGVALLPCLYAVDRTPNPSPLTDRSYNGSKIYVE